MLIRNRLKQAEVAVLKSMTTEELEAMVAGEPEIDFSNFSDTELDALIYGYASPALEKKYLDARAKAEASK